MDIEMPVLDGISAVRIIRDMERSGEIKGHIPILAVTANARKEQVDNVSKATEAMDPRSASQSQMKASGFDGTVSKPFKIPDIMARIKELLLTTNQNVTT